MVRYLTFEEKLAPKEMCNKSVMSNLDKFLENFRHKCSFSVYFVNTDLQFVSLKVKPTFSQHIATVLVNTNCKHLCR